MDEWWLSAEVWIAALALGMIFVSAVVLWVIVADVQKRSQERVQSIEVRNLGNTPACFELRAADDGGLTDFNFLVPQYERSAPPLAASRPAPHANGAAVPLASSPGSLNGKHPSAKPTLGFLRQAADYLPGSVGIEARSWLRQAEHVDEQVNRSLAGAAQVRNTVNTVRADNAASTMDQVTLNGAPPPTAATYAPASAAQAPEAGWARTPYVAPGQTALIRLWLRPRRPSPDGHYPFRILSRVAEISEAPVLTEQAHIEIHAPALLWQFLPYALIGLAAIGLISLVSVYTLISLGFVIW